MVDLAELDAAAMQPPTPERFQWENRRLDETQLQWAPDGRELLYASGGDLFVIAAPSGEWRPLTKTAVAELDPKFSPDGKMVAFRREWDLYVLNVANGKETRLTTNGSETLRNGGLDWVYPEELNLGTAYWWSPDSKAIAYLQFDVSKENVYPHEDLSGRQAIFEPQRYPQAGSDNPSVRMGVVPAKGGSSKWLDVGDTVNAYLIARAGWAGDSQRVYVVRTNRVQNELEFLLFDVHSGARKTLYRETDRFWINVEGEPIFLKDARLKDAKQFLWTSERSGFRHLYLFPLDGAAPRQLTAGSWEVTDVYGIDEREGCVYFRSSESSPLERQLYRVQLDGSRKKLLSEGSGTHRIWLAAASGAFLDVYSSLTSPPAATLRNRDGSAIAVYRNADRSALDDFALQPTEIVEFMSRGGVKLYGRLIKPPGFDPATKYPVIVDVYGGPHVQSIRNLWARLGMDQVFAQKGYLVWEMDNRGTAGRGHAFESAVYRNLGAAELADQREGIAHLIAMGFVDPQRIGVTGWSYGGFMTVNMLLNAGDVFHAGFAGAPVTNWLNYDTIYTERYMGLLKDNDAAYAATALSPKAANLRGRLMIAHNFEDDNVLFQNTLQLITALESAGKQFDLALYPQKTHGVTGAAARQMEAAMLDFFERTLVPEKH